MTAAQTGDNSSPLLHQRRYLSSDLLYVSTFLRLLLERAWLLRGSTNPRRTCASNLDLIGGWERKALNVVCKKSLTMLSCRRLRRQRRMSARMPRSNRTGEAFDSLTYISWCERREKSRFIIDRNCQAYVILRSSVRASFLHDSTISWTSSQSASNDSSSE